MSDKVKYSIVNAEDGNISVQSTIQSFGLDHVTEKDILSFYNRFSQYAAFDTGLLPVEGSGILSIRTAGVYTQFAYQHKPGLYHVNWAAREGGTAASYYVAQPYRIIICDMQDGNLLGARMFYSPYPINHPSQPLYHVNLPNINCRGYRGNGVGWICLYQNEDWSHLPLNERIVRFIERCSGVETYNDANMSETDGTRFYKMHSKPEYLWNPLLWQDKSTKEGFEWTLDESLWIPVLVESMDSQTKHVEGGQALTFADALVGDYQAYYYDEVRTKPINAIIRPDKELPASEVLNYFVRSYNNAAKNVVLLNDTFNASDNIKKKIGSAQFKGSSLLNAPSDHANSHDDDDDHEDEQQDSFCCYDCEQILPEDQFGITYDGESICISCVDYNYVYIEAAGKHFHNENDSLYYSEVCQKYFHSDYDEFYVCSSCGDVYGDPHMHKIIIPSDEFQHDPVCLNCLPDFASVNSIELLTCSLCSVPVIPDVSGRKLNISSPFISFDDEGQSSSSFDLSEIVLCYSCSYKHFLCPCGQLKNSLVDDLTPCVKTSTVLEDGSVVTIDKSCISCKSAPYYNNQEKLVADFVPVDQQVFVKFQNSYSSSIPFHHKGFSNNNEPF